MNIGSAILSEAAISFLGMGVQPPNPSWGIMIQDGQAYLMTAPWLMIMPGLAILTTVLPSRCSVTVCATPLTSR